MWLCWLRPPPQLLPPPLTCADGLPLSGDDHHVLVHLDAVFVAQDPRQHDLGAVADGVDLQIPAEGGAEPAGWWWCV